MTDAIPFLISAKDVDKPSELLAELSKRMSGICSVFVPCLLLAGVLRIDPGVLQGNVSSLPSVNNINVFRKVHFITCQRNK